MENPNQNRRSFLSTAATAIAGAAATQMGILNSAMAQPQKTDPATKARIKPLQSD